MTAASLPAARGAQNGLGRWLAPAVLLGGLAAVVGARWWATLAGLDALVVGAAFGLALAVLAIARRRRASIARPPWTVVRRAPADAAIGAAFGLALVAVVVVGAAIAGAVLVPGLGRPAAPFLPWVAITVLVATGEEALLRGRLFDAARRAGGLLPAIAVTTFAFALMHVPLYGWHVVPLDLAVGLAFAGLRLATRGVVAPAAAHAAADLATWWL
jgi:membrane protease YdiL (CAAX protease family)